MTSDQSQTLIIGDVEAAIQDFPRLQDFLSHWRQLSGDRTMPSRDDFRPIDVPQLLRCLWLADVVDDADGNGIDFNLRVVGTMVEDIIGRSMSLKLVSELPDEDATWAIRNNLEQCRASGQAVFESGRLREDHKDYIGFASLTLPLSENGEQVTALLSVMEFISAENP